MLSKQEHIGLVNLLSNALWHFGKHAFRMKIYHCMVYLFSHCGIIVFFLLFCLIRNYKLIWSCQYFDKIVNDPRHLFLVSVKGLLILEYYLTFDLLNIFVSH